MTSVFAFVMATGETECLFRPCNSKASLQTFKTVAIQKIVATSKAKRDDRFISLPENEILAHKSCYCSYTSKSRNKEQMKKKSVFANIGASKRLLKSQCSDFVFKRDCVLCGKECIPKDSKNPRRWVPVKQCTTVDRGSKISFKQRLENLCDERRDQWATEVMARLSSVIDLHAADAQYHVQCYNRFRVIPVTHPTMLTPVDEALRSVLLHMTDNVTETWTTTELYSMYQAASGTVSKKTCHIHRHILLWRRAGGAQH